MTPPSGRPMAKRPGPTGGQRSSVTAERPAVAEGADSGSGRRFALFAEVRRRLAEAARPSGLVLVLDDLQWADEASAALLTDVVRQLRGTPILVFATYRDSVAPDEVSAGLLQGLSADANTERVDLRGLPAAAVGEHAARRRDCRHRRRRPTRSTRKREAIRSWSGSWPSCFSGAAAGRDRCRGGWSRRRPTGSRICQVPPGSCCRPPRWQATASRSGVVAKMLDVPVLALLGPLDECRAAGFLVTGDRRGDHRFSHALVGSAVIARLSAAEQRRLHTAAADAIEALYEGQVRLHLAEVARHRVEASWPGDRMRAVAACEAAAAVAAESLAFEEAVRLYRQALSVGEEEIGEDDRSRLELALAAELHRSGDLPGAQQTAVQVGRRAEARRDRLWLARTALVMEASGVPEWDGEICRFCEQALAGDDVPDDLRARVSARYAQALVYRGENDRAGEVSRDALAVADAAGDAVALVDALQARQLACSAPEGLAERVVLAGRMLETADRLGSAWVEMWGRLWRIDTLFETGQLRVVQRELADLGSFLERFSGPVGQFHHVEGAATLALATGRFTEAARLAREGFKVLNDMGHPAAIGALAVILYQSALHVGLERSGLAEAFDLAPAHVLPEAVDTTRGTATVFPALTVALIRLLQGDRADAEAAYALAGPVASWTPMAAMRMASWGHGLALAIGLQRTEDIDFFLAKFEPFRGQHAANGAGPGVYMGPVELQLGLAAAALGRLDAAVEDLQATASICDANGARGYAVQARVELAAALTRRQAPGDLDRARTALDAAVGEAERLGMVPFTERIGRLRARLPAVVKADSPLSPREIEVARLVARGLTNKQIGEALFVSERTAENHVQHILVKLGFGNRSQIAAWAADT